MRTRLIQFEQRVAELELLAGEIEGLAYRFSMGNQGSQPDLSVKTRTWFFAAQGLLEKTYPEKVEWLEHLLGGETGMHKLIDTMDPSAGDKLPRDYREFRESFATARGLVVGSLERQKSLEYDALIQLSSALVSDEFETAHQLFEASKGDESILRAAGTIGRVALERHLFTVAEARNITIEINPPTKKATANDVINTLDKAGVITKIQKSEIESLFKVGNNCAHPKEAIRSGDIERLLLRGKELTSTIV
jgi:hypothetical protein